MNQISRWRLLAQQFPCISTMIHQGKLPEDYQPSNVIELYQENVVSSNERRVLLFLLHVWNRYEYPFELSEAMTWDSQHINPFIGWVSGHILGQPFRYC